MMKNSKKMSKKYMKALSNYIRVRGNFTETEKIYWCHIVRWTHSIVIKWTENCIHAKAIPKSPLSSAYKEFSDAKIGLKVMKENSPNKITVGNLHINPLRNKFDSLQNIILRNWQKSRHSALRKNWIIRFLQYNLF